MEVRRGEAVRPSAETAVVLMAPDVDQPGRASGAFRVGGPDATTSRGDLQRVTFVASGDETGYGRGQNLDVTKYLIIGLGGFLGANCRYLVSGWMADCFGSAFPYGTLVINVSGSFAVGLLLTLFCERFITSPSVQLFFAIGFLGGYTTFATFSFETLALIEARSYLAAVGNLVGSVTLGMLAVVLGAAIGRLV